MRLLFPLIDFQEVGFMKMIEAEAVIEAVLFAAGEAVPLKSIAEALEQDKNTAKALIKNLIDKYKSEKRGIAIIEVGDSFQMCTNPDYFENIKKLYSAPKKKSLTPALLETLAIIAYKQPITRAAVEEIRGVSAEHAVNRLMEYNLVVERGRLDAPGKPILFGTSDEFLKYFGFSSLNAMPDINASEDIFKIEAEKEIGL